MARDEAITILDNATGGIFAIVDVCFADGAWSASIIDPESGELLAVAWIESDGCEPRIDWA
jgi:hypothetical protein